MWPLIVEKAFVVHAGGWDKVDGGRAPICFLYKILFSIQNSVFYTKFCFLYKILGACRRQTPRSCTDVRVYRRLLVKTVSDGWPSVFTVGMLREKQEPGCCGSTVALVVFTGCTEAYTITNMNFGKTALPAPFLEFIDIGTIIFRFFYRSPW